MTPESADEPTRVLLLDDRSVIREAATVLLAPYGFDVSVVASAPELLTALRGPKVDVVMLDYLLESDPLKRRTDSTPNGLALVPAARDLQPGARIVIFSDYLEQEMLRQTAHELGVDGMISKGDSFEKIAHGLRQVMDPGVVEYVSPSLRRPTPRGTGLAALTDAEMKFLVGFVRRPGTRAEVIADQRLSPGNYDTLINGVKQKVTDYLVLAGDPRVADTKLISTAVLLQWAMEQGIL